MKNRYFKLTKTIGFLILLVGIVNITKSGFSNDNLKNICVECLEVSDAEATAIQEQSSQIEDWMTDDQFWKVEYSTKNLEIQIEDNPKEEVSEIENWMIDESFWIIEENENNDYVIEPWMIDPNFWQI